MRDPILQEFSEVKHQVQSHRHRLLLNRGIFCLSIGLITASIIYFYNPGVTIPDLRNVQQPNAEELADGSKKVTITSGSNSHYVFVGSINDTPVKFFYDTGASFIAIPSGIANHLGLFRGEPIQLKTAKGISTGYTANLGSVKVGNIKLKNVEAVISEDFEGDDILLGMSFLRQVSISQNDGQLQMRYTNTKNH